MYAVFRTQRFDKELSKQLSPEEQREIAAFEQKRLVENPYVGDMLGYRFFREKKIDGKRVYYLIYDDLRAVLMVAVSTKKTQQATINEIHDRLKEYHEAIKEAIKQRAESDRA